MSNYVYHALLLEYKQEQYAIAPHIFWCPNAIEVATAINEVTVLYVGHRLIKSNSPTMTAWHPPCHSL